MIIFTGKNTPLKRYKPYFPNCNLRLIQDNDHPKVILCHSLGIVHAIQYCNQHNIYPNIVCMDGTNLIDNNLSTLGFNICMFRKIERLGENDETLYTEIIYYDLQKDINHYPYMNKNIRDKIITKLKLKN